MGWSEFASTGRVISVLTVCVLAIAGPCRAQDLSASEAAQRTAEVERWVGDYHKWQEWRHHWLRKGSITLENRKPQPQPPSWLVAECRESIYEEGTLFFEACGLLVDWNQDYVTADLGYQAKLARSKGEATTKTKWWEHIHIDAFWPMMRSDSSIFGVVGAHATVEIEGRFQVFVTPGVMLLSVPTARGTREWKPATDWGVAYRLFDFHVPMTKQPARLHFNFVRAWMLGNVGNYAFDTHVDLAGFSVTLKKPPK